MRLRAIEALPIALPPRRDARWRGMHEPLGRWVLVRAESEDGIVGWGEATALGSWGGDHGRYYGETPTTVRHVVEDLLVPALLALDPEALPQVRAAMDASVRGHPYAKAAVEMALRDLQGRALGVPLHVLLGGRAREDVLVAHMIGLMGLEEAEEEARAVTGEGAQAIQLKGTGEPDRDVALVETVRAVVPADVVLRLDANQGYRHLAPKAAAQVADRLHAAGAALVEQPTEGVAALAAVRARTSALVVADESCWTAADLLELHAADAVDAVSIYVAKAGGLDGARRVADLAAVLGLPCDVNGSLESGVGNAANLHFAVSAPAVTLPCVIPVSGPAGTPPERIGRYYADDVVAAPFPYRDGRLAPPEGPGLGIEVDEEKVRALRPT